MENYRDQLLTKSSIAFNSIVLGLVWQSLRTVPQFYLSKETILERIWLYMKNSMNDFVGSVWWCYKRLGQMMELGQRYWKLAGTGRKMPMHMHYGQL
jgi:hypothetical protein